MEKLIESRGQYDELRYKVGEELRTIWSTLSWKRVNTSRLTVEIEQS